jgi:hypothetical protein
MINTFVQVLFLDYRGLSQYLVALHLSNEPERQSRGSATDRKSANLFLLIFVSKSKSSGWARIPHSKILLRVKGIPWLEQWHFIDVIVEHVTLV